MAEGELTNFVVESRVREFAKTADVRVGGDFVDALNKAVQQLLSDAVRRTLAHGGKTLGAADL